MSPEQAQGKAIDARSDIFSFGSVLYEMMTGRCAFQGETRMSTLAAIIEREPQPLPAETPHDLEKVVSRCLRKDPNRRTQHMGDVKLALEELKEESDSGKLAAPAPAPRRAGFRRWGWAGVVAVLLAIAGAATWLVVASRRASTPVLNPVPLTSFPGYEREPSFSPDGNQVAFSWNGEKQDNYDIYVMLVGGGKPLRLTTDPAKDFSPAWSPDGRNIAFLRSLPGNKAAVLLVAPLGGPERKLCEVSDPGITMVGSYLAWSPNGDSLAVIDRAPPNRTRSLFLLSVETGQ
jgi:hypothetical protein